MKDVNYQLRKAYISALEPLISVPVYDTKAPAGITTDYVLLMNINAGQIDNKCTFYNDVALTLNVVTRFELPARGNFAKADGIAGEIMTSVLGNKSLDMSPDFIITGTKKDQDNTVFGEDKTHNVYIRVLTFRSKIQQI